MKFIKDERVKCVQAFDHNTHIVGKQGIVLEDAADGETVSVQFDEFIHGHNGGLGKEGHCWNFRSDQERCLRKVGYKNERENNMNQKIMIHIPSKIVLNAVAEALKERGFSWLETSEDRDVVWVNMLQTNNGVSNSYVGMPNIFGGDAGYANRSWWEEHGYKLITLDDFFASYCPRMNKPLVVSDREYQVHEVDEVSFKVGCTRITWEEYDKIGKLRPSKRG